MAFKEADCEMTEYAHTIAVKADDVTDQILDVVYLAGNFDSTVSKSLI